MKTKAILYNWKTVDRFKAGFSLSNRPKKCENTSDWHHARGSCFRDIPLQFTTVRSILKNYFLYFLQTLMKHITFITIQNTNYYNNVLNIVIDALATTTHNPKFYDIPRIGIHIGLGKEPRGKFENPIFLYLRLQQKILN